MNNERDFLAAYTSDTNELYHHGILGQKWGVRRYQNEDGSLTEAGKKRYYTNDLKRAYAQYEPIKKKYNKASWEYDDNVTKMLDHYDKAYIYNSKTNRFEEDPIELKKAREIEEPIKKQLMKYFDKDPDISQYYTDTNGNINVKDRENFWLDNMGEDFASDPYSFGEYYIAQTNPELHEDYNNARTKYLTAAQSAFSIKGAKDLETADHEKMWLTDFMKEFEEYERESKRLN